MSALAAIAVLGAAGDGHAISVTVTGTNGGPCDMSCYDVTDPGGGDWWDYDPEGSDSENDGSPGGPGNEEDEDEAAPQCKPETAEETNLTSDAHANGAQHQIRLNGDYKDREYAAIIHMDSGGTVRMTALVPGTATGVILNFSSLGVNPSSILGVVHNHPTNVYDNSPQEAQINRAPSEQDWDRAHQIVDVGDADPELLQLYILGPDNIMRQYPYLQYGLYQPTHIGGVLQVKEGQRIPASLVAPMCP